MISRLQLQVQIVPVPVAGCEVLRQISIQTFTEAFAHDNAAANMQQYIDHNFNSAALLKQINNPHSQFYLAYAGPKPAGYLKINTGPAQTEPQHNAVEIERIYVLKDFQARQVGQQLLQKAIKLGRRLALSHLWLGVWEHNHNAIAFYRKNGFAAFDKHTFMLGGDAQTDILMKLPLDNPKHN